MSFKASLPSRLDLTQSIDKDCRLVGGAQALRIVITLLADVDPVEDFALQPELTGRLLHEIVIQAAVHRLARGTLAAVSALAEKCVFPILTGDLVVVLKVAELNADDGHSQERFLPQREHHRTLAFTPLAAEAGRGVVLVHGTAGGAKLGRYFDGLLVSHHGKGDLVTWIVRLDPLAKGQG
jgi:hypothetical protein